MSAFRRRIPIGPRSLIDRFQTVLEALGTNIENVYVIGGYERRVTVKAQQVRAINLISAIGQLSRRTGGSATVAVVGGGIAGCTTAVAAACAGNSVVLLESGGRLMSPQTGSHRYLHPNLYDWPQNGWDRTSPQLPLMAWSAGDAGTVVRTLRKEFKSRQDTLGIEVVLDVELVALEKNGESVALAWGPGFNRRDFDFVVLCVGFGQEGSATLSNPPYWHNDDLNQGRPVPTLVSGCGDGGLVDVLRVSIEDLRQEDIEEFLSLDDVKAAVEEIELGDSTPEQRSKAYLELASPRLDTVLAGRLRPKVPIYLNGTAPTPFEPPSSPVNRYLVSRLIRSRHVTYVRGRLPDDARPDGGSLELGAQTLTVTRVVRRHGPPKNPLAAFPNVIPNITAEVARKLRVTSDVSRHPNWDDRAFARCTDVGRATSELVGSTGSRAKKSRVGWGKGRWTIVGGGRAHAATLVVLGFEVVNVTNQSYVLRSSQGTRTLVVPRSPRVSDRVSRQIVQAAGVSRAAYVDAWKRKSTRHLPAEGQIVTGGVRQPRKRS